MRPPGASLLRGSNSFCTLVVPLCPSLAHWSQVSAAQMGLSSRENGRAWGLGPGQFEGLGREERGQKEKGQAVGLGLGIDSTTICLWILNVSNTIQPFMPAWCRLGNGAFECGVIVTVSTADGGVPRFRPQA
eukprot:g16991.t1